MAAIGVHHHPDGTAGGGKVDLAQERVAFGQIIHHTGNDGLREDDGNVVEGLLGVCALHSLGDSLVVIALFGGQLADAPGIQCGVIQLLAQAVDLALVLFGIDLADGLAHLHKDAGDVVGRIVFGSIGQALAQAVELLAFLVEFRKMHIIFSFSGIQKAAPGVGAALRLIKIWRTAPAQSAVPGAVSAGRAASEAGASGPAPPASAG